MRVCAAPSCCFCVASSKGTGAIAFPRHCQSCKQGCRRDRDSCLECSIVDTAIIIFCLLLYRGWNMLDLQPLRFLSVLLQL